MRTRSDQGHFAGEYVEELRYLIDVPTPQKAPDAGDARVTWGRLPAAVVDAVHGSKFYDAERLLIKTIAPLREEDRSGAIEANENRDGQQERGRYNQRGTGNGEVKHPLLQDFEARKRPACDLQARNRPQRR